jgi:hypothetical protein
MSHPTTNPTFHDIVEIPEEQLEYGGDENIY